MKTYTQHYPARYNNGVESWSIFVSGTTFRADIWCFQHVWSVHFYIGKTVITSNIEKKEYGDEINGKEYINKNKALKIVRQMLVSLAEIGRNVK